MTHDLINARRPSGFLDFYGETYIARKKMLDTIYDTALSFGFDMIETPIIEFKQTLSGEKGETGKQIFSIANKNTKNEQLALRFDHTVPFARFLAQNPYDSITKTGIRLPLRRMAVGPVFRGEHPQKGRYRQFTQFDIDIAGTDIRLADAEIVLIMHHVMQALNVQKFHIKINNRKILNGLSELLHIDLEKLPQILRILDKCDKIGVDAVCELLQANFNDQITQDSLSTVKKFLTLQGTNNDKITYCKNIFHNITNAQEGIEEIESVLSLIKSSGIKDCFIHVDFSIARGLDYYTGMVMETVLEDALDFGSVFSGGRYDGLVHQFTGQDLPSVGASIGVDRLFAALQSINKIKENKKTLSDVMILRITNNDSLYLKIAHQIRTIGYNVEINLYKNTTFKQQFQYALERGVKYVIICGENEINEKIIQIKNLITRQQVKISQEELSAYFNTLQK